MHAVLDFLFTKIKQLCRHKLVNRIKTLRHIVIQAKLVQFDS